MSKKEYKTKTALTHQWSNTQRTKTHLNSKPQPRDELFKGCTPPSHLSLFNDNVRPCLIYYHYILICILRAQVKEFKMEI